MSMQITWKWHLFLIFIFYSASTWEEAATPSRLCKPNETKVWVRSPLGLQFKAVKWKTLVQRTVPTSGLEVVWTYFGCPCFKENSISCLKKRKKEISQENINIHSAAQQKYAVASFHWEGRGNWDFTLLTSFSKKCVPRLYKYILLSAFNRVPEKKSDEVTFLLPPEHRFLLKQERSLAFSSRCTRENYFYYF